MDEDSIASAWRREKSNGVGGMGGTESRLMALPLCFDEAHRIM